MGRVTVKVNGDGGDGDMGEGECYCYVTPPWKVNQTIEPTG